MEKKKYIKPEIEVLEIDGDCNLLAGSTIPKGSEPYPGTDPDWEYVD